MSQALAREIEDLLRELAPQILAALVRRHRQFDACEDAVQEALVAAARQWPAEGVPQNPRSWLIAVANRRLIDELRADHSRRTRELAQLQPDQQPGLDEPAPPQHDDTLTLLLLCCHPALTPASQVALTLRAVGGLTTTQIAAAFLVPEATMAQRISRAKQTIRDRGSEFELPAPAELPERLRPVLRVLYLVFTEGHTATAGAQLQRLELAEEALRLTRILQRLLPNDGEIAGLLALMLLTHARRDARVGADQQLIPLAAQDRARWDREAITEGVALVEHALAGATLGPYQLQAAIAALHDEAATAEETDWEQILALYTLLLRLSPNPVFALNRAVAVAMARGPQAGLAELAKAEQDPQLAGFHRVQAVRAHMLELAGQREAAVTAYRLAAQATHSLPERRYLESRAAAI